MVLRYKPDEGRNARQAAFWLGMGMVAYGCYALRQFLLGWPSLARPISSGFETIPVLGLHLNASLLAALTAFVVLTVTWVKFLARHRVADHLIEVENEMKKVTWPTFKEASNSSLVVIATVLILMSFLALSDWALGQLFQAILWRGDSA